MSKFLVVDRYTMVNLDRVERFQCFSEGGKITVLITLIGRDDEYRIVMSDNQYQKFEEMIGAIDPAE